MYNINFRRKAIDEIKEKNETEIRICHNEITQLIREREELKETLSQKEKELNEIIDKWIRENTSDRERLIQQQSRTESQLRTMFSELEEIKKRYVKNESNPGGREKRKSSFGETKRWYLASITPKIHLYQAY